VLFNSFEFAVFLAIILLGYSLLGKRGQNLWLLCASYTFYGLWDWRFLTLIAFSTTVDYLVAQRIGRSDAVVYRKQLLILSLFCNLGLLGIFKYFNFFIDSFVSIGAQIGLDLGSPALRLLPPVGISFYTFQSMAYSIDVYRRELKPERNYITFALFISYFPQLVAGPIERARRLLPQLQRQRHITLNCIKSGLVLILIGLFKKVVVADNAGVVVNRIFNDIENQSSATLLAGGILFTLQIYCDFSGYSNMARGMSRLLGIHLVENFKTPYLSANINEFWRRWHISLSQWLRDYLFIPLGGSREGERRTHRNLLLTMLLGGLWHGAGWTFVLWGFLNGMYLMVHRWWQQTFAIRFQTDTPRPLFVRAVSWMAAATLTYLCVLLAFIVFRAESLSDAIAYLHGIASLRGEFVLRDYLLVGLLGSLIAPLELIQFSHQDRLLAIRSIALPLRSLLYALMVISLLLASSTDIPFIYFQF